MQGEAYDFIVTGAGSAGCAVAGRLIEDGRYRVLLLEAGPKDSYPWIHIPLGYHKTFNNPRVNWMFDSEPEPELNNRIMYQPRGKVLGGTSSINGMVYMRGNRGRLRRMAPARLRGLGLRFGPALLQAAEDQERGADEFHGVGGPLQVSDHRWQPTLAKAMHEARPAGRHPGQSRLQRRAPRKASATTRPPSTGRGAGRARRAYLRDGEEAPEPHHRHLGARHPRADRERPRGRRRIPHARRPQDGARQPRGHRLGRRLRLAAAADAVGPRPGASI